MPISRERFEQGLTADAFIEQMTRNRERFEANIEAANDLISDDDRAAFLGKSISIAAIAEDWCTDVIQFLPPIVALARQVPDLRLRVFLRDQNLDIMDQYLKEGKYRSIPVFVFYDEQWNELGHYNERPEPVTQEMARETRRFAGEHPELEGATRSYQNMPEETRKHVFQNSARYRWEHMQEWDRTFLDEVRAIVGNAAAVA
ncbi:thioredoxin family protein [Nitrolancea hollandica]|uniref:Thioredoxin family protein n=1 Tax=Nitrolancea hollandica Lb TaxID=1129897 RepID=I4EDJ1_9BACT|nr:thioredoxin family protein [Nitrolancea hollandica]CCF82753.1 conserved hypothetical protein [Nitrolancea hollandica Lb]